jgi:ferredoxin
MPRKYHIEVKNAPPRFPPVGKFSTVEFREECAGSCKQCVKKKCVHEVFKEYYTHIAEMPEPEFLYTCQSCFRCVQECTKGIFTRVVNPEYKTLGNAYWTPDILHNIWYQAHTGKVPVSGAGYRGRFSGTGFDAMWTDMSEIVRPTRDGIHGREYISTTVDLARHPMCLNFSPEGTLVDGPRRSLEIPLPVIMQLPGFGKFDLKIAAIIARAARELGTLLIIDADDYRHDLEEYEGTLLPRFRLGNYGQYSNLIRHSRIVEIAADDPAGDAVRLRQIKPGILIGVSLPLNGDAPALAARLAECDIDMIHFYASEDGREIGSANPRPLREMIRTIHNTLVSRNIRPTINLVYSGGIALAEHLAKAVICGADAAAVDIPLLVALECRLCTTCTLPGYCPVKIQDVEQKWGSQRLVNLAGGWHNQLLEVMGACGIREARRLRGETGRALFMEDLEKASFAPIFGERKIGCG